MTKPEDQGKVYDIFYNNYDHIDHSVHEIEQDMESIKIMEQKMTKKGGR